MARQQTDPETRETGDRFSKGAADAIAAVVSPQNVWLALAVKTALEPKEIPTVDVDQHPAKTKDGKTIIPTVLKDPPTTFTDPASNQPLNPKIAENLQIKIEDSVVKLGVVGDEGRPVPIASGVMVAAPTGQDLTSNLMLTSVHNIAGFLDIQAGGDYIAKASQKLKGMVGQDLGPTFLVNGEEVKLRVKAASNPDEGEQVLFEVRYADEKKQARTPFQSSAIGLASGNTVEKYNPSTNKANYGVAGYSGSQQQLGIDPFVAVNATDAVVTADKKAEIKHYVNLADLSNADVSSGDSGGLFFRYSQQEDGRWTLEHAGTITARDNEKGRGDRAWATLNGQSIVDAVKRHSQNSHP